jgi:hypothetical protein
MKYLEQYMGEAGGGLDKMAGKDTLYDVLVAIVNAINAVRELITAFVASPTAVTLVGAVVEQAGVLTDLRMAVGICGTAGTTTAKVYVNGVEKGSVSVAHDDADGTVAETALTDALAENDVVTIALSAVATGAANVTVSARTRQTATLAVR